MSEIELSICIPTYNRADYIGETLKSIIEQSNASVEIIISDNASNDNTEDVVNEYKQNFKNITYYKWPENMGADANYLKVIELASGRYCWFMGSDDVIEKGGVDYILTQIKETPDCEIFLAKRLECDIGLIPMNKREWFKDEIDRYDTRNNKDLIRYFNNCISLGGVFSYLSTIVFKKERWKECDDQDSYIGTAYIHAYLLLKIVKEGAYIALLDHEVVLTRGGNASFLTEGVCKRIKLDFDGYCKIADELFKYNVSVYEAFLGILRREHKFNRLIKISYVCNQQQYESFKKLLIKSGWNKYVVGLSTQLRFFYGVYAKLRRSLSK